MWTFDRLVVIFGILATLITAVSPVTIAMMNARREKRGAEPLRLKKRKRAPVDSVTDDEPEIQQGIKVDITSDYLTFLKDEIRDLKRDLDQEEAKNERLQRQLSIAMVLLQKCGIDLAELEDPQYRS